ncbi:MAG TPA: hypothetical protein VLS90_14810 [Thermodesulfobacteriota bacterium]|nr:hypothetical protein [Thermodesulfobacteriota bacterium]
MGGLVLLTLGVLFILDRLIILEIDVSWPLILVAIGVGMFLSNPHSLGSWVLGGIGVILFIVKFVIAFFPEVEAWSDLVWPTILVIVGILLLYRYYRGGGPDAPVKPKPEPAKAEVIPEERKPDTAPLKAEEQASRS